MHNPGIHTSTLVSHEDSCFTDITFQADVKKCVHLAVFFVIM